jgi:FMN phosphatase YigB (HAD superfamily)
MIINNLKQYQESNLEFDVAVFDMDGTLYGFGDANGFGDSLLAKSLDGKVLNLIQECEVNSISKEQAANIRKVANTESSDEESVYLARRYGMTRDDFFECTWGCISPEEVLCDYQTSYEYVRSLYKKGVRLYLLTAAPRVWANKVLNFLGVREFFTSIYTASDFSSKEEVFVQISLANSNTKCVSFGDQMHTDILPAVDVGMTGVYLDGTNLSIELIVNEKLYEF